MKNNETAYIILAIVIGYFIAMLLRKAVPESRNKVTFVGVVGSFASSKYPGISALFGGAALYDLGHQAGFTLVKDPDNTSPLGKILKNAIGKEEIVNMDGKTMVVKLTKWFPAYYRNENGILKPTFWDMVESPYQENGVYFIRKAENREIVYIGVVIDSQYSFQRLLRHFSTDDPRAINHRTYNVGAYGDDYEIRIAQIQSPTRERLTALEAHYNYIHKPKDSYQENEILDAEYEIVEEREEEVPF